MRISDWSSDVCSSDLALLLKERIGRRAIGASLLGLVGVAVILSGRVRGDYDTDALLGAGAVLVSAVLFAWNLILQRQQAQLASPIEVDRKSTRLNSSH